MRRSDTNPPPIEFDRGGEEGTILVWALMIMVLTSGMVISHATYMSSSRKDKTVRHIRDNLGTAFTRSGLSEALTWFQNQPQQPVESFTPVLDPDAEPPRYETIDPSIGLVREFEIHGNLWGRYEIRKDETREISAQRPGAVPGSVWEVGVRSYIYRVIDPSVPFDKKPNRLLSSDTLSTEIRTVKLNLPATAAICTESPGNLTLGKNAIIDGRSAAAIAYKDPATEAVPTVDTVTKDAAAVVTGDATEVAIVSYDSEPLNLFRMRKDEVKAFADIVLTRKSTKAFRVGKVRHFKNSVMFSPRRYVMSKQFTAENVLLVVNGDLEIRVTNQSSFSGVIYVDGNVVIDANLELDGALIATGSISIGEGDNLVKIRFDQAVVDDLRKMLNKYRPRRGRSPRR